MAEKKLNLRQYDNRARLIALYKKLDDKKMLATIEKYNDEIDFTDIDKARKEVYKFYLNDYILNKESND